MVVAGSVLYLMQRFRCVAKAVHFQPHLVHKTQIQPTHLAIFIFTIVKNLTVLLPPPINTTSR
jgi:uncharacterized membrane-anchored protein